VKWASAVLGRHGTAIKNGGSDIILIDSKEGNELVAALLAVLNEFLKE
jgi:hypothetical protein